ncbi:MAG: 30S ribosomal protein S1 [Hydrogenibacillus schlegelii]|nr:30S ribosomal protein S1 [Hydrogenibacillus schlegelii]
MMDEHEAMHGGELAIPQVGDRLTGKVVKIEDKQALVDVGYKYEAILPISEVSALHIDRIDDVLSVGDEIRVQVKKVNDEKEELVVSKRMVDAEEAWARLEGYLDRGEAFEVKVHDIVKGGLVADVGLRGFIPASQVSTSFVEDFSDYKGKTLKVKVLELDREQNRVILSHRAVLEEEAEAKKAEVLSRLRPGDVVEGRVARFADFGAFIDLGGVDGLVHISEVSWEHVEHPSEKLKIGDVVKVKVLKVDPESERVSLSIKQAEASPWERAKDEIRVGEIREGIVRRLASFGAFVELMPGVEGLVHISQLARRRVATPSEVVSPGQKVRVKVLAFSPEEKRVSLSIREAEEAEPAPRPEPAAKEEDKSGFGVTIGDLLGDRLPDAWK